MIELLSLIYLMCFLLTFLFLMNIDEGYKAEYVDNLSGFWMTETTATIFYYIGKTIVSVLLGLFWFAFFYVVVVDLIDWITDNMEAEE